MPVRALAGRLSYLWERLADGPEVPLAVRVRVRRGIVIAVLRGDLDLLTAALLAERLAPAMAGQPEGLVLDLARLAFIDCAGARALAAARHGLPSGRPPVLRSTGPAIWRVLQLTGLNVHFEVEQRAARKSGSAPADGGVVAGHDLRPRAA